MDRRHIGYLLKRENSGIVGDAAWPTSSQTGHTLDTDVSWEGLLGWIFFQTTNMICFVLCWKTNQERIDVCAVWMVITAVSSSEKFLTWACQLICFYRQHHPCTVLFAAEILILKKIIAEIWFFLRVIWAKFPQWNQKGLWWWRLSGTKPHPCI